MSGRFGGRGPIAVLCFMSIFALAASPSPSEVAIGAPITVDCESVRDTTIFQGSTGNSNGIGTSFAAGRSGTEIQRGLIQFDLTDVPAGATVTSATLQLYVVNAPAQDYTNERFFWLQALEDVGTPSWGEGTSNADLSANPGQGAAATPGDATWLYKVFDTKAWPGGNGAVGSSAISYPKSSAAGSVPGVDTIPTASEPLFVSWPKNQSTDQMIEDIQAWVDGTMSNDGWIVLGEEGGTRTKRQFASREDQAYYPVLQVTYTVPEPSTFLLAVSGAAAFLGWRWRARRQGASHAGRSAAAGPA